MTIKIIGAGLAGATVAQQLAYLGKKDITVYDSRNHVGGNVHTYREEQTGVMVHAYGPHIFHTDDKAIWDYVRRFVDMRPYIQRTKATVCGEVYSFPINLHTINQVYRRKMSPNEARAFIGGRALSFVKQHVSPQNFEQLAVSLVGPELYPRFLRDYTLKQWGRPPTELPASILKRLPLRWTYDDNAYDHPYQGIPVDGYTRMVENMLDHPAIKVKLGCEINRDDCVGRNDFVFYSGAIDEWFDYSRGYLPYRTLDLETIVDLTTTDYQGCSVLNSCDLSTPWTRSTEHRHFAPWEKSHTGTIVTREFPREWQPGDIRYYPVRLAQGEDILRDYQELAAREIGVAFIGRLGTYQYLDMDKTIKASVVRAREFVRTGT